MPRVKLKELQSYEFQSRLQVRITDINIANHLGHVELIGMMHEARHQFFTRLGVTELSLGADNVGIVIIDLVTNYLLADKEMPDAAVITSPWFTLAKSPPLATLIGATVMRVLAPWALVKSDLDATGLSRDPAVCDAYMKDPLVHNRISPEFS